MKLKALFSVSLLALMACQQDSLPPATTISETPTPRECQADALQYLVGQSARTLETMRLPAPTRIIQPGMAVTMDYLPYRLNISIGNDGLISRVSCG